MYAMKFGDKVFLPTGKVDLPTEQVSDYNQALERSELIEWAQAPDRFCAYVTHNEFKTFLGTKLGDVIRSNTYRNNFGSRTRSVYIRGTNGACYYGRYGSDWSQFVRVRKCKKVSRAI